VEAWSIGLYEEQRWPTGDLAGLKHKTSSDRRLLPTRNFEGCKPLRQIETNLQACQKALSSRKDATISKFKRPYEAIEERPVEVFAGCSRSPDGFNCRLVSAKKRRLHPA